MLPQENPDAETGPPPEEMPAPEKTLRETAARFPGSPGVYIMKDAKGAVIYVGKAKSLKNRVRSYFLSNKDIKTRTLVRKISAIEYIVTENEYEALLLENTLIKKHTPRYNINLKDGKSYPVIRITAEDYPRIFRTRRMIYDGSQYFGPYPDVASLDIYLDLIEKLFPLRKCRGPLKKRGHPCLYHHIGRCAAPCAGRVSREDYMAGIAEIQGLLSGRTEQLIIKLTADMHARAKALDFENAARLRDLIRIIEDLDRGQKVVDFDEESRDYIDWAAQDQLGGAADHPGTCLCSFVVFQMRGGRLLGRDVLRVCVYDSEAAPEQFLLQYYQEAGRLPGTIYLREIPAEWNMPEYFFREMKKQVRFLRAADKRDIAVLNMVKENAAHDLRRRLHDMGNIPALEDLKSLLRLPRVPLRIEGFDIAQLSGKHPVASMVSFYRGAPDKKCYRSFHIKTLAGEIDDFESVREVVARRYTRVKNEEKQRPDLVLIDGGKGQVSAARGILDVLGLKDIPVIGLAKKNEEIFLADQKHPVILPEGSPALRILQAVRDEAHRFATGFNKRLRQKSLSLEKLASVPGIGEARGRKLMQRFGSTEEIAEASGYDIAKTAGISLEVAEAVKERLDIEREKP
ncbi:MAG: excinuclease ABC subunit UvrC [Spirochaetales bacterium]|jgi:excinuclease ABC subunit C|nr:excinuclease ABC subunit UvrC [Spirochaetales bacterium]